MTAPVLNRQTAPVVGFTPPPGASDRMERDLLFWVRDSYPMQDYDRIMGQDRCEIDDEFLGFLDVYYAASLLTSANTTVIDFGCYVAAQAALFAHCRRYVGVDTIELERFSTANTVHSVATIQDFITANPGWVGRSDVLAVCSYVPDADARALVNESFPTVVNFYPSTGWRDGPAPAFALLSDAS